jgi:hypothetical protein
MTTTQWIFVALGCMIAGMVVSRLLKSADGKKTDQKRKNGDR